MISKTPHVSIVILHWRGIDDTLACLDSLESLTYPQWNLVLVLNGASETDTQVLDRRMPESARMIRLPENIGFAAGCNAGIDEAVSRCGAEFVVLLNNDTYVDPGLVTALVERALSSSRAAVVGAKTYDFGSKVLQFALGRVDLWRGRTYHVGWGQEDIGQFTVACETDFVQGSCLLVRSCALDRIGLLDETFFAYWEETDLCLRAREAGFTVLYEPEAHVWHHASRSSASYQKLYYLLRNNIYFMRKHARWYQWLTFLPYFVLHTTPVQTLCPFLEHPRETLKAVLSAYKDGFRLRPTSRLSRTGVSAQV